MKSRITVKVEAKRTRPGPTIEEREALIREMISTPEGRDRLAEAMTLPLRVGRDYTAVGRRTFLVEELPEGALPIYDRDPNITEALMRNTTNE